jgi:hypothetical protein
MPSILIVKIIIMVVVVGVLFSGYKIVDNAVKDYAATKQQLATAERVIVEKDAEIKYQMKSAELETTFQTHKNELVEATNEKLSASREREQEANNLFTASRLEDLSNKKQSEHSTVTVNERLTNRAASATRKKLDRIESLSDWNYSMPDAGNVP